MNYCGAMSAVADPCSVVQCVQVLTRAVWCNVCRTCAVGAMCPGADLCSVSRCWLTCAVWCSVCRCLAAAGAAPAAVHCSCSRRCSAALSSLRLLSSQLLTWLLSQASLPKPTDMEQSLTFQYLITRLDLINRYLRKIIQLIIIYFLPVAMAQWTWGWVDVEWRVLCSEAYDVECDFSFAIIGALLLPLDSGECGHWVSLACRKRWRSGRSVRAGN